MESGIAHCAGETSVEVLFRLCGLESVSHPCVFSLPLLTLVPDLCVSLPVIYFYFPETKQKTLEEIDELFERVVERIPEEGNVVHSRSGKEEVGITAMNIENAGRLHN